jgi:hypothetical protein
MNEKYAIVIGFCCAAVYALINAFYAVRSPTEFLRARWTARRGLSPETRHMSVRGLGLIYAVIGAFLAWESIRLITTWFFS